MIELLNGIVSSKSVLIFDLDGTMVDTDEANFLAYKEAVNEVKKIDLFSVCLKNKRLTRNKLKELLSLSSQEYKDIIDVKNAVYEKYLQKTSVNESILQVVHDFSKNHKTVLSTNSHQERADLILKHHHLMEFFDDRFYKNNYKKENNKFKYVIEYLKIDPRRVIVFENEYSEVRRAKLIGIPHQNIIKL